MKLTNLSYAEPVRVLLRTCIHCGNPVMDRVSSEFCCSGCETVFHWIQDHRLEKYYELKTKDRPLRKPKPVVGTKAQYTYLDDPEFLVLYSWGTPEGRWMDFYLEGVHCAACVWLTEKVAEIVDHVGLIRLNLGTSIATVRIDERGTFAAVAGELQKMGYRPHPVRRGEHNDLQQKENRLALIRLGVAGASAGNIMLLAVSLYGGATGAIADQFRWISFGLFLPVLLFSAVPFYKSAWNSIKSRELAIDIPVIFGILLGSAVSILNLVMGNDRVYFDSLSTLVFLLLSTRYLLKRTQQTALNSSRFLHFLTPSSVRKWNPTQELFQEVKVDQLSVGDSVQILPGESIPVDGIVLQGASSLDCSLLSGESQPEKRGPGSLVFAGTENLDAPLLVQVTQSGSKTRVGRILDSMENLLTQKAPITLFADRVSRYFVAAVVILSGITFSMGFFGNWHEALNRALAIAIVTCPCTFALITPLALSMTLGRLAKFGILVKGPDVLEKLVQIRSVFLDKTGTLTFGTPQVIFWNVPDELSAQILALESHSIHPIAKALVKYLDVRGEGVLPQVEEIHETRGLGIRGRVQGQWIELRRAENASTGTEVSVLRNDVCVGTIVLSDEVRPESKQAVDCLRSINLKPWILSGDHSFPVGQIAKAVGIDLANSISEASPEKKAEILRQNEFSLMVGDGANDAIALAQSYVGVAVQSGVEISLRAADVYLSRPGIKSIYDLVVIARETLSVVKRNFWFSIFYNLVAGGFALAGKIDPLFAAILMPISALTVFLSSVIGTSKMREAFGGLNK